MSSSPVNTQKREGSLVAPTRHSIAWKDAEFYDVAALNKELERVFDICHGCRRCVSLCNSFPTLFDLVDESSTMEVDGVDKKDYIKVVDECYMCDLCYMTKCPYVPPHEWNVDFPHLMLRAKAIKYKQGKSKFRDKVLTSTDMMGRLAGIPVVVQAVNAANKNASVRKLFDQSLGIHPDAIVPEYHSKTGRKRLAKHKSSVTQAETAGATRGKVALFVTCYGNYNKPELAEDLVSIFEHNAIPTILVKNEKCCGMPKLELGDLEAVDELKKFNIPALIQMIDGGWDIVAPVPSCVLMFKQELPLMYPEDEDVQRVKKHIYDPFEYLMLRNKAGKLNTDFKNPLGKVAYHAACHLRVQNIGLKTRDLLKLVPNTELELIERCSGHDGIYAVKSESHEASMKICRPIVSKIKKAEVDHYSSDCPMAGDQIHNGLKDDMAAEHPLKLLRKAYGI